MHRKILYTLVSVAALIISTLMTTTTSINTTEAANTAEESLVEDSRKDVPVREFAGQDRYSTSLKLANAYVEEAGYADTLIVASGETLVDAAAAHGLAGYNEAPILLTRKHSIGGYIVNFIERNDVGKVIILGGDEAISTEAAQKLYDIPNLEVERIGGGDRYETSALMAEKTISLNSFCEGDPPGVIVLNADKSFGDAIAIGPLANALQIPILLTESDVLPVWARNYLNFQEVYDVIIIGGVNSVSNTVEAQINTTNIRNVFRVSGDDRYETSVEIAKMVDDCQDAGVFPESNIVDGAVVRQIALVNGDSIADGVSSAPILGDGINGDAVIPILLTGEDDISKPIEDYLADIPTRTEGGTPIDVEFITIGGEAAVPGRVVSTAISYAENSDSINASIDAMPFYRVMNITFSDPVDPDTATNRYHYLINGEQLIGSDIIEYINNTVTVTFPVGFTLDVGDEIEIVEDKIKGGRGDNRFVQKTVFVVPSATYSLKRSPKVNILAAENAYEFRVQIADDDFRSPLTSFNVGRLSINNVGLMTATSSTEGVEYIPNLLSADNSRSILVCLFGKTGNECNTTPLTGSDIPDASKALLEAGDVIRLQDDTFEDRRGNRSKSARHRVESSDGEAPRVQEVLLSDPRPYEASNVQYNAKYEWALYDSTSDDASLVENYLTIEARFDAGEVAGAQGNEWTIQWSQIEGGTDEQYEIDIDVATSRQAIIIRYDEETDLNHLAYELINHADVEELFTVSSDSLRVDNFRTISLNDTLTRDSEDRERNKPTASSSLEGGSTVMEITLRHNQVIRSFSASDATTGFEDANSSLLLDSSFTTWFAPSPLSSVKDVVYRVIGIDVGRLPKQGDEIILPEGMLSSYLTSMESSVLTNTDGFLLSPADGSFEIE